MKRLVLVVLLGLAGCGGVRAGGEYSGVPDIPVNAGRGDNSQLGYMRTDGTIILNRETGDYQPYPRR